MDEALTTIPLTPDVSRNSPDLYRKELLHIFNRNTIHGKAAFDFIVKSKGVTEDKITFNPDKWQSRHNEEEGQIVLGTAPMTLSEKEFNFPFETNSFNDERIIIHKLAHEISHFLGEAIADQKDETENTSPPLRQYEVFIRSFANLRRNPSNTGITSHGGDERYMQKGPDIQAVEDMTDLLAYYIVDPQYLKRYLSFLSDPKHADQRGKLKLITLQSQAADSIYNNISKVVDGLLLHGLS